MDGDRRRHHQHLPRVLRQDRHEIGPGSFQVYRRCRGQGRQAKRTLLHSQVIFNMIVKVWMEKEKIGSPRPDLIKPLGS